MQSTTQPGNSTHGPANSARDPERVAAYFSRRLGVPVVVTGIRPTFPGLSRETLIISADIGGESQLFALRLDFPWGGACPFSLEQASTEGLERGIRGAFAADSHGLTGGGGKGTVLPAGWMDRVGEFTGVPKPRWELNYGSTEITGPMPLCAQGYYHIPVYFVPFLLQPDSGAILPREGRQTGRFAAFDALAQNMWGGVITGDKVTIEWDRQCSCGRKGAHIHDSVERYSESVTGDDKVNCAATVDNTDTALQSLLMV